MSVIDLSRAYRHFPVSQLNWPLLSIGSQGKYYFKKKATRAERKGGKRTENEGEAREESERRMTREFSIFMESEKRLFRTD